VSMDLGAAGGAGVGKVCGDALSPEICYCWCRTRGVGDGQEIG
jgi:hypothetical protein